MTFTAQDLQKALHDNNGKPIKPSKETVVGYGYNAQLVHDVTLLTCVAKKIIHKQSHKNQYFLALNRSGGLFIPQGTTESGRSSWINCNEDQFNTYLGCLRSGNTFALRGLKDELNIL